MIATKFMMSLILLQLFWGNGIHASAISPRKFKTNIEKNVTNTETPAEKHAAKQDLSKLFEEWLQEEQIKIEEEIRKQSKKKKKSFGNTSKRKSEDTFYDLVDTKQIQENESIVDLQDCLDSSAVKRKIIKFMGKRYYGFGRNKATRLLNLVATASMRMLGHMYIFIETEDRKYYGLQMAYTRTSLVNGEKTSGIELVGPFKDLDELDEKFASKPPGADAYTTEIWQPFCTTLNHICIYIGDQNNRYNLFGNNCKQFAREFGKAFPSRNPFLTPEESYFHNFHLTICFWQN